jgi:hypothetical protein
MSVLRPTYTTIDGVVYLTREEWIMPRGGYSREDGPAYRQWSVVNGQLILTHESWYLNGLRHRVDEPAYREWRVVDGQTFLVCEGWYLNCQSHRIDGPGFRRWLVVDGERVLTHEAWYLNGQRHRIDGSAWRQWVVAVRRVALYREEWHLKGTKIHPRILRQPVRAIERWWQYQQARRQQAIEASLWDSGMTVFPGFMGLLREY